MRNGLSMYPMGLPRVLQQNQVSQLSMDLCEGNGYTNAKAAGALHVNQDTSLNAIFSPSENRTETKLTPVATMSNVNHSNNAFESESSINVHLDPFQLSRSTCKVSWMRPNGIPIKESICNHLTFTFCLLHREFWGRIGYLYMKWASDSPKLFQLVSSLLNILTCLTAFALHPVLFTIVFSLYNRRKCGTHSSLWCIWLEEKYSRSMLSPISIWSYGWNQYGLRPTSCPTIV